MLRHFLIAIGGMLALMVLWSIVQFLARRQPPASPGDCDLRACQFNNKAGSCFCGARRKPTAGTAE